MATVVHYAPAADYISFPRRQSETITESPFPWDQSFYGDLAPLGSQSCDLVDMSPGLPNPLPSSNSKYTLSLRKPDINQTLAPSFMFGDFDDLMDGWDDPTDTTHTIAPEMDPAELHAAQSLSNSVPLEDSMNDEPPFQSPQSLPRTSNVTARDCVYSPPLSWERPKLDCRVSNAAPFAPLSPEEESRLLAIAIPVHTPPITPPLSPLSEAEDKPKSQKCKSRKRKSSESSESDFSQSKSTHNMVEKRYRTNLNDKIAALRESIPSLRVLNKGNSCGEDSQENLPGSLPAKKLNKATILSSAAEHITYLEKRNKYLTKESQILKSRIDAFELLLMAQPGSGPVAYAAAVGRQAN